MIAVAGAASLPAGATVLALNVLPAMRRPVSLRPVLALQAVLAVAILALGTIGLLVPSAVPRVPQAGSAPAIVLLVIGAAFFALLAVRAARTYTLTRRTTDLLASVGCVWLGWALVPQLLLGYGTWAFYFGHAMELLGIVLIAIPAVLDLRHGGSSRPLVGDLAATELVGAEEAFLGPRVRSLMVDLAAKDRSTEEHTRRVATLACAVGEELRLPPATLRHLAIGGLLHDMGKLRVPPGILCKPSALDPHEFALIKRHPEDGARLLADLGGFPAEVLDARARPPRAARRRRLPARPAGDADQPRHPRAHGLRRLRRARLRPRLPARLEPRPRARAAARGERGGLRPRVRRRARARARPRRRRPGLGRRARAGAGTAARRRPAALVSASAAAARLPR